MTFRILKGHLAFVFCVLMFFRTTFSTEVNNPEMTDEDRLRRELFKRRHYNPDTRPVRKVSDAVQVELAVIPVQIAKVDSLNEILKMHIWLEIVWTDFRLTWNASDYGELTNILVRVSQLWAPDIYLKNSAANWKALTEVEVNAEVRCDGSVHWFPPVMTESYCPIDISWFPFDKQRCVLEFESWSYDCSKLELTLKNKSIDRNNYRNNSEWDLIDSSMDSTLVNYVAWIHPANLVTFTLHLRRRTLFYWINLILPCSLLSALSALAFILPPQSGERISLEMAALLALNVHQLLVIDNVPTTSDATPLIGIYFACVMIMNAASLVGMVIISNLYHRSVSTHPIPNWVKTFICKKLGKIVKMRNNPKSDQHLVKYSDQTSESTAAQNLNQEMRQLKENVATYDVSADRAKCQIPPDEANTVNQQDDWQFAALVIDRLCFFFCIVYITIVTAIFYAIGIVAN